MLTNQQMVDHILSLCKELHIDLIVDRETWADNYALSSDRLGIRSVHVAPIKGEITYASVLHEIGHLNDWISALSGYYLSPVSQLLGFYTKDEDDVLVIREHTAWEWAMRHALEWTPKMAALYKRSINTYERYSAKTARLAAILKE